MDKFMSDSLVRQKKKSRLTAAEVEALDPYALMAVLGKRVIHPGGRSSTEELLACADFQAGQRVLDVGCKKTKTRQTDLERVKAT